LAKVSRCHCISSVIRGCSQFHHYIPSNPGIKWWLCCESENSNICDLNIYGGEEQDGQVAEGIDEKVVRKLIELFKGYDGNITADKYFTILPLAETLLPDNFTLVGTMRKKNRKFKLIVYLRKAPG
jgi:hypothetical protein